MDPTRRHKTDIRSRESKRTHDRTNSEADIKALEARYVAAFNRRDVDAIMRCYAAEILAFDVIPPRQYAGAAAYRKAWENFIGAVETATLEMSDLSVTIEGSVAFGHNIQHVVAKDHQGQNMEFTLRTTDGYRKIGGRWLIVHEHFSVPVDLATGKPDLMSTP